MSSTVVCVVEPVNNKVLPTDKTGLPWELWQIILSWLSVVDLCHVARVCRTWNELVNSIDGTRWKELYLACNEWRHPFWPLNTKVEPPSWRQAYRDQYMATTFWKWRHKHEVKQNSCTLLFKRSSLHKTIHVGAGLEHENLKSALAVANAYDRIVVHPGIYDEQFEITAKIPFELIGDGELGSIILVVGIQQVALTARLSNLVLRAPWFTSFIVMINSGYLQIDKCILEEGMICAQSPSTLHIKFCTFRHATVILQHMNTSVIENCEFSQSYSANIIIEGQPKSEKNWTYTYLREQTNAIFHQKRSMHRKKHGLKNTTSMTSTLHSSFTSKSLTTGYSTHIYDTISHDPSCNLDDPGATFLHPNILSGRYPGTDKDGMVGCGDLQSMYQEPDDPELPSTATRKSSLSLPATKPNPMNKTSLIVTSNSSTPATTNADIKPGMAVTCNKQTFKTGTISTLSSKPTWSETKTITESGRKNSNLSVEESTKAHVEKFPTNGASNINIPTSDVNEYTLNGANCVGGTGEEIPNSNSRSDIRNNDHSLTSTDQNSDFTMTTATVPGKTMVNPDCHIPPSHPVRKSSQESKHEDNENTARGKVKSAKTAKRRSSKASCQMNGDLESHPLPPSQPESTQTAASSLSQTTEASHNHKSTRSDSFTSKPLYGSFSRTNSREEESLLTRKERSGSLNNESTCITRGHSVTDIDNPLESRLFKTNSREGEHSGHSVSNDIHNNNASKFSPSDPNSKNHNKDISHLQEDSSPPQPPLPLPLLIATTSNSSPNGNQNQNVNLITHHQHKDLHPGFNNTGNHPSIIPELKPLSPSDSSTISALNHQPTFPTGPRQSPSTDQFSLRQFHSEDGDSMADSDDDSISILDELDQSDPDDDYPGHMSSSSSSDSSSDILSANYTGSGDEFSSSEESVIMLPHLREFDLEPIDHSTTSPRGVEAEVASINSECTRPVPVNVSEDKMMSSFVDHIQGVLVHQCRMNHSKGGLMVTLQAHAIISECEINNVGYGIRCIHNSRVVILKNKIHHCRTSGIFMRLSASGLIAGNDIHSNNEAGIDIRKNADPLVQFNQIHNGKRSGVVVLGSGRGQIKKNDIFCNAEAGVYILYGGNPTVSENYIYEGRAAGVAVNAKGKGFIIDNVIRGNRWGGIDIRNSSCPVVSGNSIINGLSDGIVVGVGGKGNIENNNITGNSGSGIWMMSAKHLNIHGNQICCNGHCGVMMLDKSTSSMDVHLNQLMPGGITHHSQYSQYEDNFTHPEPSADYAILQYNNISHNKSQGVVVEIQEEVHISHNAVHGNLKDGIVMVQDAPSTIANNSITHNSGHGLVTSNRNKVKVSGNGIYDNTQHGVLCQNECVLEDNDVVGQGKCAVMADGHSSLDLTNNRLSSSTEPAVRGGKQSKVVAKRNKIYDKGGGDFVCEGEITAINNTLARPTLVLECTKKSSEKEFGRTDFLCDPPARPHAVPPPPVTTIPTHRVTVVTKVMMPSTEGCEQGSKLCVVL